MDAKTIVRRGVELWNAHDRDGFLDLFDDSVVLLDQATGRRLAGREELGTSWYDAVAGGYPDREVKFEQEGMISVEKLIAEMQGA